MPPIACPWGLKTGLSGYEIDSVFPVIHKNAHFSPLLAYNPWFTHSCLVIKSCPNLCDPMDCSSPGSSVHGISQVSVLNGWPFSYSGDLPNPGISQVFCIDRWVLYHWATREELHMYSPKIPPKTFLFFHLSLINQFGFNLLYVMRWGFNSIFLLG